MAASGQRGGDEAEDIIGRITLEFTDWFQRRPANEIFAEIRERSAIFGGVFVEARKEEAGPPVGKPVQVQVSRSEEHTSELQSLMRISYAVFCLKKKTDKQTNQSHHSNNSIQKHHKTHSWPKI